MADDALLSMLTTGGGLVAGGGVSAVVVRAIFQSFSERIKGLEEAFKAHASKFDGQHDELARQLDQQHDALVEKFEAKQEKLIERIAQVEREAQAAHRRIDSVEPKGRRR